MRPTRLITAVPVAVAGLLLAGVAPAGATASSGTGWQLFAETGSAQTFTVPAGVVGVTVALSGAGGGEGWDADTGQPVEGAAGGGEVSDLATTPGSTLEVVVGGAGGGVSQASPGGQAGYPAGSDGTLVEGTTGGGGGTQSAPGGAGGTGPDAGSPGVLNVGGAGTSGGGGGGGGYYGGGGGGVSGDNDGTGGGGGSSYGPAGAAFEEGALGSVDGGAAIIWATASSLNITVGDSVTVTANLPFAESGSETFPLGGTTLCSDVAVGDSETASCQTAALPVGTDDVTATYTPPDPPGNPYAGTTEVVSITVAAASTVPVPTLGAGSPAGVPPVAPLLVVLGCAGILAGTRLHWAR